MCTRASAALTAIAIALSGSAARADSVADQAHALYEAGRVQYNLGDYVGAIREFSAGYKLTPRPEFLVNMGQAYRRLGQPERAREMYVRYLAEAPADEYARAQVHKLIAEADRELARRRSGSGAAAEPRSGETDDDEPDAAAPATLPRASLTPAATVTSSPRRDFWRRNWWIVPVSAAAVTGLVVGIYFGTRPSGPDCSSASLGCLGAR